MALTVKVGMQVANNVAVELESDNVSDVVQAMQDFTSAIEANIQRTDDRGEAEKAGRKGLIIPEVKVSGPIREGK